METENNNECKIVQDLMPSYLENLLSAESKAFVDKHISTCNECKEYLKALSEDILSKKSEQEEVNKLEIDSLKKYRKKITTLKRMLLIVLIIVITILSVLSVRYIYNKNIVNKTLKEINELKTSNNFYINRKTIYIDYINNTSNLSTDNIYYKDGKYKRVGEWSTMYGSIDSNNYLKIYHETKTIEDVKSNSIPYTKDQLISLYFHLNNIENSNEISVLNAISIKKLKYNGRECYVVRTGENDKGYNEFWIDKDTNIMFRQISEQYSIYYREHIYTLILDKVSDKDVQIDNLEQYSTYTKKNVNS